MEGKSRLHEPICGWETDAKLANVMKEKYVAKNKKCSNKRIQHELLTLAKKEGNLKLASCVGSSEDSTGKLRLGSGWCFRFRERHKLPSPLTVSETTTVLNVREDTQQETVYFVDFFNAMYVSRYIMFKPSLHTENSCLRLTLNNITMVNNSSILPSFLIAVPSIKALLHAVIACVLSTAVTGGAAQTKHESEAVKKCQDFAEFEKKISIEGDLKINIATHLDIKLHVWHCESNKWTISLPKHFESTACAKTSNLNEVFVIWNDNQKVKEEETSLVDNASHCWGIVW